MRSWQPIACILVMLVAAIASRFLDGWPGYVALGIAVAALVAFLIVVLWRGGGPPGKGPGLRPPPIRYGGGTLG